MPAMRQCELGESVMTGEDMRMRTRYRKNAKKKGAEQSIAQLLFIALNIFFLFCTYHNIEFP